MSLTACPSERELSAYLVGELSDQDRHAIDGHISTCRSCGERLTRLTTSLPSGEGGNLEATAAYSALDKPARDADDDPPTRSPGTPQAGTRIAGRYVLRQRIGQGGMGEVWLARQTTPVDRSVAIKLIKLGMDSKEVVARFEQERQALAMMDHPLIARVLDGGVTPSGSPFFVMEWVDGLPLNQFCRQANLSLAERLQLFLSICEAVQHAHQKAIVHRDLKPGNILVSTVNGKPTPKVIDFGVAKAMSGKLTQESLATQFGAVIGTLEYMAPEQAGALQEDVDTRADIYALGVVLYELLTGLRPIAPARLKQATFDEVIRIIREEDPPRPSVRLSALRLQRDEEPGSRHSNPLVSQLRGELDWIVMRCLEKQRERRYATANELSRDLQRYLNHEPVEARPASLGYRTAKYIRRNRVQVTAAVLVMLALIAGITGTSVGLLRADQQRRDAEYARDRTRAALDAMTSSLTGDSLASQQELSPEQQAFLEEVLVYYREFASERGNSQQARLRTAAAAARVGEIEFRLGRLTASANALRQSVEGYIALTRHDPDIPEIREQLNASRANLAMVLHKLGRPGEARDEYARSLNGSKKLVADFPKSHELRRQLATDLNNFAIFLLQEGELADALKQFNLSLELLETLSSESPDDAQVQESLATARYELGMLLREVGQLDQALEQFNQALTGRRKLAQAYPKNGNYRQDLATSYSGLGLLMRAQGKHQEALQYQGDAIRIFAGLASEFPAVPEHKQNVSISLSNLGNLMLFNGQQEQAKNCYLRALEYSSELVDRYPSSVPYQQLHASNHNHVAMVLKRLNEREQAIEHFHACLRISEDLAQRYPANDSIRIQLGGACCNLANLYYSFDEFRESLTWYGKAIATLAAVLEEDERVIQAREFLGNAYYGRGNSHAELREHALAVEDYTKALALQPANASPRIRILRAKERVLAQQFTQASAELEALVREASELEKQHWYQIARIYAIAGMLDASDAEAWNRRAIESLREAIRSGWSNTRQANADRAFQSLREQKAFQQLMSQVPATSASTAPNPEC